MNNIKEIEIAQNIVISHLNGGVPGKTLTSSMKSLERNNIIATKIDGEWVLLPRENRTCKLIMLNVDYEHGLTLPDGKISKWVESNIKKAINQNEPIQLTIGSDLIIIGFRFWAKSMQLSDGDIQITYNNGAKDKIDEDGNISYVHPGSNVMSDFMMKLF